MLLCWVFQRNSHWTLPSFCYLVVFERNVHYEKVYYSFNIKVWLQIIQLELKKFLQWHILHILYTIKFFWKLRNKLIHTFYYKETQSKIRLFCIWVFCKLSITRIIGIREAVACTLSVKSNLKIKMYWNKMYINNILQQYWRSFAFNTLMKIKSA